MSKTNSAISGAASGASIGAAFGGVGAGPGALIGGALGFLSGSDDESGDAYAKAVQAAQGIPLPILKEMNPEAYRVLVKVNPELESQVLLQDSNMGGISLNPEYQKAQLAALSKLQDITGNNGRDAQFEADAARLQSDVNTNLQGQTGAIRQDMAQRGLSGGMSELVARQMASQQGANRQAQMGLDLNAQAQKRALDALMNQGNLGGQMQAQEFSQKSDIAKSQDLVNQFNARNSQDLSARNADRRNNAMTYNADNENKTGMANTAARNDAQMYNIGLGQKNFDNQLARTGLTNRALDGSAQNSQRQAQAQDQFLGGAFSSVAKYGAEKTANDYQKLKDDRDYEYQKLKDERDYQLRLEGK